MKPASRAEHGHPRDEIAAPVPALGVPDRDRSVTPSTRHVWASKNDFHRCTWRNVTFDNAGLRLRRGVTLADESGRCTCSDREWIAGQRVAKKTFLVDALAADRAVIGPYLDCDTDGGELEMHVNGHVVVVRNQEPRSYWEARWRRVDIPASWLVVGENEIVFRAVGSARWSLLIEESCRPDRSHVSDDGGATWRSDALGENDRADGEYLVRLWLDQYHRRGEVCSEPVDLLKCEDGTGMASAGEVTAVRLRADASVPPGTGCTMQWRVGPSPDYRPEMWTAWADVGEADHVGVPGDARFFQWRALLEAIDPAQTPVLAAVELTVDCDIYRPTSARVASSDNPPLVRSSYRFSHLSAEAPRGRRLRERWKLDDVVRGASSEFDALVRLRQWTRNQWENGWDRGEIDFCPPWDAMVILELASRGLSLGMCTHYATVMSHSCAALGFVARTQIMRNHCINEVWSSDHGKWVAMDVGGDQNDETKFTYHFERDGVPLSALEAHRAWVGQDFADIKIVPTPPAASGDRFVVEERLKLFERFMVSMRNDELVTMGPGEPEHGATSYHYDRYLFWEDEHTPPLPWFSRHTSRPGDLYWTVNRAVIHLQQGMEPGVLRVQFEAAMPNLARFEVQIDDGQWVKSPAAFEWTLHDGDNRLAVRPVNACERPGAVSWVVVRSG